MGAWIETNLLHLSLWLPASHPTWVRGLKHNDSNFMRGGLVSHPTWVRGLKRYIIPIKPATELSHPTWVRGLKLFLRDMKFERE